MSKPQVTMTHGRSRQGELNDSWGTADAILAPTVSKRSMPQSFESSGDALNDNKRMRNYMGGGSTGYSSPFVGNESSLDPKDLRSKLIKKRMLMEMELEYHERKKIELYEKVSKNIRSMKPPDDMLLRSRPSSKEAAKIPNVGSTMNTFASRPSKEPANNNLYSITPSMREAAKAPPNACDLSSPFASWPSNVGTKFSERIPISSNGISTPRNVTNDLLPLSPLTRKIEGWQNAQVGLPGLSVQPCPLDYSKLVTEFPPAAGVMSLPHIQVQPLHVPKESQPHTVSSLLHSLGLGKYYINFQAEEIDMSVLKQMGEADLKELGIPMGPRKKIFLAVQPRTRCPVTQPSCNYFQTS